MKIKQLKTLDRKTRLKVANHFFLATAALFVIHQNVFAPNDADAEVPFVAQALNAQPQTPPPAFDPDQVSVDEPDLSIRPEERQYSPAAMQVGPLAPTSVRPDERQYSPTIARSAIVVD